MQPAKWGNRVSVFQGVYYAITGVWPIVSRGSFEAVTGPKMDFWLVRTIGALLAVIDGVLALSGLRGRTTSETALLGIGSAASLAGSDVIYGSKKRIPPVYLLESLAEFSLIGLWGLASWLDRHSS